MNKKLFYSICLVCLTLAGQIFAADPIGTYTLRFEGKTQSDNSTVALRQITLSNLSQGCDTTFTATTFQLDVMPELTGIEVIGVTESMQVRLVSTSPFATTSEVEVTLPSHAPLDLTLFGIDGKVQQRYYGQFEAGAHRFIVESANAGVSFLYVSDGISKQTLKLINASGGNAAQVSYAGSGTTGYSDNASLAEQPLMLRKVSARPFVYHEGDQLQLIGYADGYANSSLYDVPTDNRDYIFLFDAPFYRMRGHQILAGPPSFVDVLFSVEDLNHNGVDNLSSEDFVIKENGVSVGGTSESFAYIRKMNTVPYKIQTVLMLDNSYSLSLADLEKMKAAAIKMIDSKEDNQEIAVYSFSGPVTLLQDYTTDKELLKQAVEGIQDGVNSTNLYGAYVTGVNKFTDVFNTQHINQGFMVVFTDGDDTQASYTLESALSARGNKRVYMVGLGHLDATTLNRLANPGPYFPVNNADELEQVFLSIQRDIVRYSNSFYWLNFLSPKRNTSNVTLQVEIAGNPNIGSDSYYSGSFSAYNFEDSRGGVYIDPYINGNSLEGYASDYTFTNLTQNKDTLSAVTYYAENTPSYVWTSSDDRIAHIKPLPQSFNQVELIFPTENNPGGTVTITVRDEANTDRSGKHYERSIQARAYTVPKVTTKEVTDITHYTAVSGGTITDEGGYGVTSAGVRIGTSQEKLYDGTSDDFFQGNFTSNLSSLKPGTTYYVQAYAVNRKGTGYGKIISFKTPDTAVPTVTTKEVIDITHNTAVSGGIVIDNGGYPVTLVGVRLGTSQETLREATNDYFGSDGNFTSNLSSLQPGTTYYMQAYAINEKGTGYGKIISFKTPAAVVPTVTTGNVANIDATSARCTSTVSYNGGLPVSEQGICWSTTNNPTTADSKATGNNLSDLQPNTTYYVRAYAINDVGTGYGEVKTFKTELYSYPRLTTNAPTDITGLTATLAGSITYVGLPPYTEKGFCYSTTNNPTVDDNKMVVTGNGTGDFTANLTGLTPVTTYYFRAYAINEKGVVYGSVINFRTLYIMPTVTIEMGSVHASMAYCFVRVNNGGDSNIKYGMCYSATNNNPTTADMKSVGNAWMEGLSPNTTYYARGYAVNAVGTAYSEVISFTTIAPSLPNVNYCRVSDITNSSVTLEGMISPLGDPAYTERGFVISTTEYPTTSDRKIPVPILANRGLDYPFSTTISELSGNTTYFVRAYATNIVGTTYGRNISFTTK